SRVAGERQAERRRQQVPEAPARRRLVLPTPRLPRLPRLRRQRADADRPSQRTEPRGPTGSAGSTRSTSARRLTAVLAVLVLLSAVGVTFAAVQLRQAQATESAAADAQVTAARYAEQLLSYHHAHLDRDFSQAQRLMTDSFVKDYNDATKVVRDQAVEDRAVIKASAVASSVVDAEPDEVRTLLFVNQTTTTGTDGGSPSIDLNRVVMTLVEEDGGWLVSDLDAM
ncbi:MAG: hypothetical protein M3211_10335, partial [Actinomycetota bacterium]|nr:hypothetical protein [Actinomycetota bacterium]